MLAAVLRRALGTALAGPSALERGVQGEDRPATASVPEGSIDHARYELGHHRRQRRTGLPLWGSMLRALISTQPSHQNTASSLLIDETASSVCRLSPPQCGQQSTHSSQFGENET